MSERKENKIVVKADVDSDVTTISHTYTYASGRKVTVEISKSVIKVTEVIDDKVTTRHIYASELTDAINNFYKE